MSEIASVAEFLNSNSGVLTLIFTAVVALSTIFYAFLTAKLVSESRKIREVQTEPRIHITIESLDFLISLARLNIRNIVSDQRVTFHFVQELSQEVNLRRISSKSLPTQTFSKQVFVTLAPASMSILGTLTCAKISKVKWVQ